MQKRFILDNILGGEELLWIYHRLIETPAWNLSRTSPRPGRNMLPFMGFPGLDVETKGDIHNEFLAGYFRSILFRVKHTLRNDFNAQIPPEVRHIHVGAKSSFSKTEFHIDSSDKRYWTILGFLNPVWNAKDGGEFYLADEKIEYKAGRFIIFPSSIKHDGGYVVNETLSYWRIAVNIILRPSMVNDSAAD
jgi:hypothetical protein